MMTSETRPGSTPARSSAALMAMAPRSWAGSVANAPLKLPTGVRAALTMTTSSDMVFLLSLGSFYEGRAGANGWASLVPHPVNVVEACQRHCTQNGDPSRFLKRPPCLGSALGLTVPHKTVAEP